MVTVSALKFEDAPQYVWKHGRICILKWMMWRGYVKWWCSRWRHTVRDTHWNDAIKQNHHCHRWFSLSYCRMASVCVCDNWISHFQPIRHFFWYLNNHKIYTTLHSSIFDDTLGCNGRFISFHLCLNRLFRRCLCMCRKCGSEFTAISN